VCDIVVKKLTFAISSPDEFLSKYLGVYIDSDLSWQHHIDFISNKIIKFTSIFIRYEIC